MVKMTPPPRQPQGVYTGVPSFSIMSGGNTRDAKALLKMSENSCAKKKDTLISIFHAVKSNCPYLVQPSDSHLLEIPVWAYDGHMGTVTVGVGGAWSCDGHVTHVAMVIHLPSVPSNELNGRIL